MPDRISSQGRIPELDGLRGTAILMVWFGHYFAIPATGSVRFLDGSWFRLGWSGVDLFFVLSGFLIGGILLDVRASPRYFQTFYVRRFFRIIPLYYTWVVAYIVIVVLAKRFLIEHVGTVQGIGLPILAHFLFLQNFHDFLAGTVSFWWFGPTWSLAVEEQFYLVAPLFVRYFSRRNMAGFLILVTLTAPLIRLVVRNTGPSGIWLAYRLMPCRADSLAIGILAALIWESPKARHWLSSHVAILYGLFAVLLAGVAYIWRWHSDPLSMPTQTIGFTWLALFFAVVILSTLASPSSPVAGLARNRLLRDLGRISYCVYIIHEAVFLFAHHLLLHRLPPVTDGKAAVVTVFAALVTYTIAKLSWRVLESPFLRRGHAFEY